jgi:hypothetical protein
MSGWPFSIRPAGGYRARDMATPFPDARPSPGVALLASLTLAALGCGAGTPPMDSNERARAVIAAVMDSAGGRDALDAIHTIATQYSFVEYARNGSPAAPGTPLQELDVMQARDLDNGRSYFEFQGTNGSTPVWHRLVIAPPNTYSRNLITDSTETLLGSVADLAEYSQLQMTWYVYQAVIDAAWNLVGLQFAGDTIVDGTPHHVVQFLQSNGEEITLYVDSATARVTRRTTRPMDAQSGKSTLTYVYEAYQPVDGIPVPHAITVYDGERLSARYDIVQILFNVELNEALFATPQ